MAAVWVIVAPSSVARIAGLRPPIDSPIWPGLTQGIEVEGLVRRFKDVEAVAGIDLTIKPGEIYGFLGPNGAGKSTTVHMLTTLLPPTAGRATVAGFDVVEQGRRCAPRSAPRCRRQRSTLFSRAVSTCACRRSLHGISGDGAQAS